MRNRLLSDVRPRAVTTGTPAWPKAGLRGDQRGASGEPALRERVLSPSRSSRAPPSARTRASAASLARNSYADRTPRQWRDANSGGGPKDQPPRRAPPPFRPDRDQEGLRPRAVRRLHGHRQRPADQRLPYPRLHARRRRDRHDRGPGHAGQRSRRCRRRSSTRTASSAATARRARSARRRRCWTKSAAAGRATRPTTSRRRPSSRDEEISRADERQYLPLRLLPEHRRCRSADAAGEDARTDEAVLTTYAPGRPRVRRDGRRRRGRSASSPAAPTCST